MASAIGELVPRVLAACDGRVTLDLPGAVAPILLRDLDLTTLAAIGSARPPCALDLDSVEGLNPDAAAVRYVIEDLGITTVATRRPAVAARVAEVGGLGLLHVFAFDSTGLRRTLEAHPGGPRVGTLVSPGLVLSHLGADELARLPRPLVAYGLIATPARASTLLAIADSVVVKPETAALLLAGEALTGRS